MSEKTAYSLCGECLELIEQIPCAATISDRMKEPDQKAVYLAVVRIFKDKYASKFRKINSIKKRIQNMAKNKKAGEGLMELISQHGLDSVSKTAQSLLRDGILQSANKARKRFPDLTDEQLGLNEADKATLVEPGLVCGETAHAVMLVPRKLINEVGVLSGICRGEQVLLLGSKQPTQVPTDFPFSVQYQLIFQLQTHLEKMCYEFGQRTMPDILLERGWDCAELVKLSQWTELFRSLKLFESEELTCHGRSAEELFKSIVTVRRTTVNRNRTNLAGIEQLLVDAELFAELLGDTVHLKLISNLRSMAQEENRLLQENILRLQTELEATRSDLAKERADLDRREAIAIAEARDESRRYQDVAGMKLKWALDFADGHFATPSSTDEESVFI